MVGDVCFMLIVFMTYTSTPWFFIWEDNLFGGVLGIYEEGVVSYVEWLHLDS